MAGAWRDAAGRAGRPLRVLVAPDKFRGSLTAVEAAAAVAEGVRRVLPDAEVVLLPVADGGDGTVDAVVAAGLQRRTVRVSGPTGEPVDAAYAVRTGRDLSSQAVPEPVVLDLAVLELAEASGLRRLPGGRPAPLTASTRGTGELVRAALDAGALSLVLGVGGSASTDGGAGLAQSLGVRLLDAAGRDLPPGGAALAQLVRVDLAGRDPRLAQTRVVLATDVDNPLLGERGAAAVFGPQKGAGPDDVRRLDDALGQWAQVLRRDVGVDVADVPGAGAAGGTGAAALALLGATVSPGTAVVLDVVGFAAALQGADLVLTGEGSFDEQSLAGKTPVGVARAARTAGVPVLALVGRLAVTPEQLAGVGIASAHALLDLEPDPAVAQRDAAVLLARLAEQVVRGL